MRFGYIHLEERGSVFYMKLTIPTSCVQMVSKADSFNFHVSCESIPTPVNIWRLETKTVALTPRTRKNTRPPPNTTCYTKSTYITHSR